MTPNACLLLVRHATFSYLLTSNHDRCLFFVSNNVYSMQVLLLLFIRRRFLLERLHNECCEWKEKESSVWDYFRYDAVANKSLCMTKVADKQCDKLIASSNSTNLIAHLKACHTAKFEEFTESRKQESRGRKSRRTICGHKVVRLSRFYVRH